MADDDRRPARNADLNLDEEHLGLLRCALRRLDADAAARHAVEVLLEPRNLLPDPLLDRLALLDAVEMHLDLLDHVTCPLRCE